MSSNPETALSSRRSLVMFAGTLLFVFVALLTLWLVRAKPPASRDKKHLHVIGDVVVLRGSAMSRFPESPEFTTLKDDMLVSAETVRTDDGSAALVTLDDGTEFEIGENARILFENEAHDKTRVSLLEGVIKLKKRGRAVEFYRAGRLLNERDLDHEDKGEAIAIEPGHAQQALVIPTRATPAADEDEALKEAAETAAGKSEFGRKTISQDEILRTLGTQSGLFRRCYLGLLQRVPNQNQKADILLSFFIQASGKVTDARVWRAGGADRVFLKCVTEVIERTTFRTFDGDTVRVDEFPLSFE